MLGWLRGQIIGHHKVWKGNCYWCCRLDFKTRLYERYLSFKQNRESTEGCNISKYFSVSATYRSINFCSNLPCLYSTFHLEYPLVLSRFCFVNLLRIAIPDHSASNTIDLPFITFLHVCEAVSTYLLSKTVHYHCVQRAHVARGLVACLPVRLLLKSTKHNAFYPV